MARNRRAKQDVQFRASAANPQRLSTFGPMGLRFSSSDKRSSKHYAIYKKVRFRETGQLSRLRHKSKDTGSSLPNGAASFVFSQKKLISPLRWAVFRRAVTTCFIFRTPRVFTGALFSLRKIYRGATPNKSTPFASPENPPFVGRRL